MNSGRECGSKLMHSALTCWGRVRLLASVKAYTLRTKSAIVFQKSLGIAGEQVILESWNVTGNTTNSITLRVLQTWAHQFWSMSFSACKHVYVQVYVHTGAYVCTCVWRPEDSLSCCSTGVYNLVWAVRVLIDLEFTSNVGWVAGKTGGWVNQMMQPHNGMRSA